MKILKSLFIIVAVVAVMPLQAQTGDYYLADNPEVVGGNYLIYKPDSNFKQVSNAFPLIKEEDASEVIKNYGERAVLYKGENFTVEVDRSNAVYFKATNGVREIFQKKYLSDAPCWANQAVVQTQLSKTDKNAIEIYIYNAQNPTAESCASPLIEINIETSYADATGKQPASFIEKVAKGVSLVDDKRALLIKLPAEHLSKLVSVNFYLYTQSGKQVKEFINMKASENVLYINDLPKGKYKYKVEIYDGTLIKEGTVILTK